MKKKLLSLATVSLLIFTSCNKEETSSGTSNLSLNIEGLENLGENYKYEGWIIVNNSPISTGVFSVNDSGELSQSSFEIDADALASASSFVLTIEPTNDSDPAPSNTKLLSGNFSANSASINSTSLVGNFENATGKYILATPTDNDDSTENELSGVWFLDNGAAGLNLPPLATGWKYEGWVVINGTPVSTGTFTETNAPDDNATTSIFKGDAGNGPDYPGEDFLKNAPAGLTFPTNLRGTTVVISVEPSPDNSPNPFTLKPLAGQVPAEAIIHTTQSLGAGPVLSISGTVTR